jgi:hypothetical protein
MNNWQKWVGATASLLVIVSCFMHWAYYPDVQKYFTGFDTKVLYKGKMVNYYGSPGKILCLFAGLSFIFHLLPKIWAKKANLIFGALCLAFAIKSYFTYTSAYVGIVPIKAIGIYLLLIGSVLNIVAIVVEKSPVRK